MRAVIIGLALLCAAPAAAADLNDPVWTQAPDRADWARAYPRQAAAVGLSGEAKLRCAAGDDGSLKNCAVVSETPGGQGFGAAALALTSGMALRPTAQNGLPVAGRDVVFPIRFIPDLLKGGGVISEPDWLKRPNANDLSRFWPANGGAGGRAVVECVVTGRGLLDNCQIDSETPTGRGFGQAALAMTQIFLMRPMTIDGLPVGGGKVAIPITFAGGGGDSVAPDDTIHVLRMAPWLTAPSRDQMAAAFPKSRIGKAQSGHVTLQCRIRDDGNLSECESVTTDVGGDFIQAARSLIKDFKVVVDPAKGRLDKLYVQIPFDFRDPAQPAPSTEIYDPVWLTVITPAYAAQLYPDAATKAGVRTGVGTVACDVTQAGKLANCAVATENPPGLGFGAAALQIAAVMQMNPWTAQGTPVEGGRILLPVRLQLPDDDHPANAGGAAAASPPAKP